MEMIKLNCSGSPVLKDSMNSNLEPEPKYIPVCKLSKLLEWFSHDSKYAKGM